MASLSLRHLSKTYDNGVNAIRDFTLEVDDKEFMIFAGPVGCGISTVLQEDDCWCGGYYRWGAAR